jgi:ABC-2 type transport system ATP-binding protein
MIQRPRVFILDEPASALDPLGVLEIRMLLKELRAEGAAILLSSHQLSEVTLVSDRIAFLHEGRLLRYGSLDALLGAADQAEVTLRGFTPAPELASAWDSSAAGEVWRVPVSETRGLIEAAWAKGAELVSVVPVRQDLTELFLEWTRNDAPQPQNAEAQKQGGRPRAGDIRP